MAQLLEYFKIALMNIRTNKGRAFLTMLGIIIGISSVILIVTVGSGVKNGVNSGLDSLVGNQIIFECYHQNERGEYLDLTMEDFDTIKKTIDHVKEIYSMGTYSTDYSNRRGDFDLRLILGTPDMNANYTDQKIIKGRYFNENEYYSGDGVCIIHEDSAKKLFGTADVIGMKFEVMFYNRFPVELEIIGVREEEKLTGVLAYIAEAMSFEGEIPSVYLELPDTAIFSHFGYSLPGYDFFYVVADSSESQNQVAQDIVDYIEEKYDCQGKGLVTVENFGQYMSEMNQVLDYITLFIGLVAAISLLVGGIGVMNIMLVSVTERTREIGIRKALGARTSSIMLQFLSESAIITLLGGVIGIILGIGGGAIICKVIGFSVKISVGAVLGATLFSVGVGIFFGLYPARKAARLSPIEALRHE